MKSSINNASELLRQNDREPLKTVYEEAQIYLLKKAEGENKSISKTTIYLSIILSLIEPIGVFFITSQNKSDPLVPIFSAIFPLLLVWGLAYIFADKFEIHKEYDKLIKYYRHQLDESQESNYPSNSDKSQQDIDNLSNIRLIPHEIDYEEQITQFYIKALNSNERKHINVIRAEAEIKFFKNRKEELKNIRDKRLIPLPEERMTSIDEDYTSQEPANTTAYEIEARNHGIDNNYRIRGEVIQKRIDSLLELCDERINEASEEIKKYNREYGKIIGQDIREIEQVETDIDEEGQ